VQKIRNFPYNRLVFRGARISKEFDIFRYVSIFLTYFGHNLGTNVNDRKVGRFQEKQDTKLRLLWLRRVLHREAPG
jgi:hypothetical protein